MNKEIFCFIMMAMLIHSGLSLIELQPNSSTVTAKEGSDFSLKCIVSRDKGFAPTGFFANLDGTELTNSADGRREIVVVNDGAKTIITLNVKNVVRGDGGNFLCVDTDLATGQLRFRVVIVSASSSSGLSLVPSSSRFVLISGGSFNIMCIVQNGAGDSKIVNFETTAEIKTSSDGRIEVVKTVVGTTTTLNFTIHAVKVEDQVTPGYACEEGTKSLSFFIVVISNVSVPYVTVTPQNATAKPGETLVFACNATSTLDNVNTKSVVLQWLFKESVTGTARDVQPDFINTTLANLDVSIQSKLTLKSVDANSGGYYICQATLTFRDGTYFDPVRKEIFLYEVTPVFDNEDKTVEVFAGASAKFICRASGYPSPSIQWIKKGIILDDSNPRYSFARASASQPEKSNFTIHNVAYTDRGVYECRASSYVKTEKVLFTLRVRDKLGALWPFIGIVVEAIVLAIIIVVYELWRKRVQAAEQEKDVNKVSESSRLVNDSPKVRYTSGKGGHLLGNDGEVDA